MESTAQPRQISPALIIVATLTIAFSIAAGWFLSRPARPAADEGPSAEAKEYLGHLRLSDVTLKAAENLMTQQVVYINGKITNAGPRPISRIDIYCIFSGIDGREVYRERVPVVRAGSSGPFAPDQTRSFELPFDNLPDTWNQALPHLVIAGIQFTK